MSSELSIDAKRFKLIREEFRYTQQAFADLLGIPSSTADIERGKTKIAGFVLVALMKHFQINPLWIFGESQEKFIKKSSEHSILPKVITLNSQNTENILLVNEKAAAGYPHNLQDPQWYERLPAFDLPLPQFRNASYRGFQVEGDSMLPNIKPGEWVIGRAMSSFSDLINNRVYVVVLSDSVLVKKVEKLTEKNKIKLISFNEGYLPVEIHFSEVQELWLVNSKLSFGIDEMVESNLLRELKASMKELENQLKKIN
ncbi:MAG: helix-turn-helix domain-containing protein [Flavobacteriaceae bacterium]|nr:helix-turn-helix domain-containing protein [Flavobacteriaceae bacterium]